MRYTFAQCAVVATVASAAVADLTNTANYTGNYGAQIDAVAFSGVSVASGAFSVGGIPNGATIVSAFVHSNDWFNSGAPLSLNFNSNNVGPTSPFDVDTDPNGDVYDYRWDVTSLITGNGSYNFEISGGLIIYVGALTVVYEHASLPPGSVHVYEGAHHLGEGHTTDSETFNLTGAAAGPAFFQLVTQADDTSTSGEEIFYNGSLIGGPIDSNLGPFASLITSPVVNNGISETIQIDTYGDWFAMHVALITTTIPAPGALALLALGGMLAARRRR